MAQVKFRENRGADVCKNHYVLNKDKKPYVVGKLQSSLVRAEICVRAADRLKMAHRFIAGIGFINKQIVRKADN